MLDLRWIRDEPAAFDAAMARRGLPAQSLTILELDAKRRVLQTEMQTLQAERNNASKEIGVAKQQGRDAGNIMGRVAEIKDRMAAMEKEESGVADQLDTILAALPNVLDANVPDGADETLNVELRRHGTPTKIDNPQDHVALGEALKLIDFEAASRMAGTRFTFLKGQIARLERALGQFMLDLATMEHGYTECGVPLLVRSQALFGTGQLPKFNENSFQTTDERWLIPTSEVPLTNYVMDQIVDAEILPLRLTV